MNKKQMNEMITKQVAEQVSKNQKQNLLITGIGVLGMGLISACISNKMTKKHQDQLETIDRRLEYRDAEYQNFMENINDEMAKQDVERLQLLKDINENLKKQSDIFDRINFCFDQQDEFYSAEEVSGYPNEGETEPEEK